MDISNAYVPIDDIEYVPPQGFVSYWNWSDRHDNAATVRTGRLADWLRAAVTGTPPMRRLRDAVLRRIDPAPARAATRIVESNAFADLAVSGRQSFETFIGLRVNDATLLAEVRAAMPGVSVPLATIAVREVLDRVYTLVGALRGAPPHRHHFRKQLGWVAVAGDVDAPHSPVNIGCTRDHMGEFLVRVPGEAFSVHIRAAMKVPDPPASGALPAIASRNVEAMMGTELFRELVGPRRTAFYDSLVLFIHGLGSRLEESDHYKQLLIEQGLERGHRYGVLSIDLPGFGYSEQFDIDGLRRARVGTGFHGFALPNGAGSRFPVLGFFRDVIATLSTQIPGGIQHVMGGSLGGNMSLWIAEDPLFSTLRADTARVAGLQSVACWSPASIWESYERARDTPVEGNGTHMDIGKNGSKVRARDRMNAVETEGTRGDTFFHPMQRGEELLGARTVGAWGYPSTPSGLLQQAEIYSERYRKTFWATAYEQVVYSHQEPLAPNGEWPFHTIKLPLFLASGAKDVGSFGVMDIYNQSVRVTATAPFVSGRCLFMHETGHSISDEHPAHLAREVNRFFADAPRYPLWERMPGSARDIGIGAEGSVFVIGTDTPQPGNGGVYRWNGSAWVNEPHSFGIRIAVDRAGGRWVVNSRNEIYSPTGRAPGSARDIGAGPEGSVIVIGTDTPRAGNGGIHRWNGTGWIAEPGAFGTRVAIDSTGGRWAINSSNEIWGPAGLVPGTATDIGTGADGSVWVIGTDRDAAGNGGVWRFERASNSWRSAGGRAMALAVEPSGRPWVVTSDGRIYRMTRASS